MMIYGLGEKFLKKIPSLVGIIVSVCLFAVTLGFPKGYIGIPGVFSAALPRDLYYYDMLYPLGLPGSGFKSMDYFPLLPWLFLFLTGYFFYDLRSGEPPELKLPVITAMGRHSLLIYLLHQPVIYGVLTVLHWLGML